MRTKPAACGLLHTDFLRFFLEDILINTIIFSIDQKAVNQVETVVVGTLANYWDSGTDTVTVADGTTTVTVNLTADPADIDSLLASIKGATNYDDLAFAVTKKSATELYYTWKTGGVKSGAVYTANDAAANNESISTTTAGVASKGYYTENTAAATLKNLTEINISTMVAAGDALSIMDAALDKVAQMRSDLGAIENRLGYTVSNLMNIAEKTADARSRLDDADFALESARLAKAQVIQQAGTSMLSQANQLTQLVLDLLR